MSIVRVKNKYQVVIPESVRLEIGVEIGDTFEATAEKGAIVLKPRSLIVADRDEYTPKERRRIDVQLGKSLVEYKQGKSYGPFNSHKEVAAFLHEQAKKSPAKAKRIPKRRAK
jgi:bifunctional DNA-binding transcriptional regulator/antitoxin component of YhaV-PrlF toxin-antitoxin module